MEALDRMTHLARRHHVEHLKGEMYGEIPENATDCDLCFLLQDKSLPGLNFTTFWTSGTTWEWHEFPRGHLYAHERCPGRIMRVFYPWKWDMISCKYEPEPVPGEPDFKEGKVGHAITHYDLTQPHLYYCIDCQQYGIRRERDAQKV